MSASPDTLVKHRTDLHQVLAYSSRCDAYDITGELVVRWSPCVSCPVAQLGFGKDCHPVVIASSPTM